MIALICIATLIIGYAFGLLQIAHIYSTAKNVNIRKKGSGNAGTTNMFRVMGIKAGIITLLGDCAKAVAAVLLTRLLFIQCLHFEIDPIALALFAGFGCVLGHDFPFYFRFKGGKGMATTAAMLFCIGNWQMIVFGVGLFIVIVAITKYVSLGSMMAGLYEFIAFTVFCLTGILYVDPKWRAISCIIMFVITALLIFQHRKNIVRLINKQETKFYFRTSKQIKEDEAAHKEVREKAKEGKEQFKVEKKDLKNTYKEDKKDLKYEKKDLKVDYKSKKKDLKEVHQEQAADNGKIQS